MEKSLRIDLLEKKATLEQVRDQLKTEFVGLDKTIDQLIDKAASWYNFAHMQEQPRIITIWGAKNSGKLSLTKRFITLLGLMPETDFTSIHNEIEETKDQLITVIKDFNFPNSEEFNTKLQSRIWNNISKADKKERQPLLIILGDINPVYLNIKGHGITGSISADKLKELTNLYFTREQMVLLGEHHIIMPSLTSDEVKSIISNRVVKIHDRFLTAYGIPFKFDNTVAEFVYKQFMRSSSELGLSITNMIEKYILNFVSEALTEASIQNIHFDNLQIREDRGLMIADYVKGNHSRYQFKYQFLKKAQADLKPAPQINLNSRVLRRTPNLNNVKLTA